jgi:hypothetical protein
MNGRTTTRQKADSAVVAAYMARYDKIYAPSANAAAIEENNAAVARRARLASLYAQKPRRPE